MNLIKSIDLELKYLRAMAAFKKCIFDDENKFLEDEITVSLESIIPKEEFVCIKLSGFDKDTFQIETTILLLSSHGEKLGRYTLVEDQSGSVVDDFLVFH